MTAKYGFRANQSGVFSLAAIALVSTLACSSPRAAEAPRGSSSRADQGGEPIAQPTPERERALLRDFLTSSGGVGHAPGTTITKATNDLFGPLFASQLRLKADFKCYKGGCFQETIVPDWTTIERLDQAMLSPGSPFLGLPGTVHRGAPIKLPDGGLKVIWTVLITDNEYPLLTTALLKSMGRPDQHKR